MLATRPEFADVWQHLLDLLRDPVWQGIGVLVALVIAIGGALLKHLWNKRSPSDEPSVRGSISEDSNVNYYRSQILNARGRCAFRWGAVRNALLMECREATNFSLIKELCFTSEERIKEMMVSVLRHYGLENPDTIRSILMELLRSGTAGVSRYLSRIHSRSEQVNACRVAIEVAYSMGATDVLAQAMRSPLSKVQAVATDVLAQAMRSPLTNVRAYAVQYTFYLWQREPEVALVVLRQVASLVLRWKMIPSRAAFESCLALSLLIFIDLQRPSSTERKAHFMPILQQIWRDIIKKLSSGSGGRLTQWARAKVLETVVGFVVVRFVQRATSESNRHNPTNFNELAYSFKLSAEERASYKRLVTYLTPAPIDLAAAKAEMIAAIERNDIISSFVMGQILVLQGLAQPQLTVTLIKELWRVVMRTQPVGPGVGQIINALYMMQRHRNQFDPQMCELIIQYGTEFLDKTHGWYQGQHQRYISTFFDLFMVCDYEIHQSVRKTEAVQRYLQAALEKKDKEATRFILDAFWSMRMLRLEPRYRPILRANIEPLLQLLPPREDGDMDAELDKLDPKVVKLFDKMHAEIVNLLALMRFYEPATIDGYMAEQRLPDQFVNEVVSAGVTENIGGDMLWGSISLGGLGDAFVSLYRDEELRSSLVIPGLERVAEAERLHEWLAYVIKALANAVYGQNLFKI